MKTFSSILLIFTLGYLPIFVFGLDECPFCLDKILPTEEGETCCNHKFHTKCLYKIVASKFQKCPMCNRKLTLHCHAHSQGHSVCSTDLCSQYKRIITKEEEQSFLKKIEYFFMLECDRLRQNNIDNKKQQIIYFLNSKILALSHDLGEYSQAVYDETVLEVMSQISEQIQSQSDGMGMSFVFSLNSIEQPNFYIQLYPLEERSLDIYIQIESGFEEFIKSRGLSYIHAIAFVLSSELATKYPSSWHMTFDRFIPR